MSFAGLLFGTQLIRALQILLAPAFNQVFIAITLLGNDAVLSGLCAVVYWSFDKRRGRLVTYVLFFGAYLNFLLKVLIPWPRPPAQLRIVERNEMSNGFPSGHAQDTATFWGWLSLDFKKRILPAMGVLVVVAVGISRIYLGVHYPAQVIGGWLIGLAVPIAVWLALGQSLKSSGRIQFGPQVLFAAATLIPLFLAVGLGATGEVNPGQIGGYLFGFSLGAIAEDRYVGFKTDVGSGRKILRIVIGGAIIGALFLGLDKILPATLLISSFINSLILGVAVVLVAPAVFKIIERK